MSKILNKKQLEDFTEWIKTADKELEDKIFEYCTQNRPKNVYNYYKENILVVDGVKQSADLLNWCN